MINQEDIKIGAKVVLKGNLTPNKTYGGVKLGKLTYAKLLLGESLIVTEIDGNKLEVDTGLGVTYPISTQMIGKILNK